MRKSYRFLAVWLMAVLFSIAASAQVTINGSVRNESTKEGVVAVTVAVKGSTGQGTFTNPNEIGRAHV